MKVTPIDSIGVAGAMAGFLGPALEPFITDSYDDALTKSRGTKEDRQAGEQVPYALYDEAEAIRLKSPPPRARQQAQEPAVASLLQHALTDAGPEKAEKPFKTPQATDSLLFAGLFIDKSLRRKKSHKQNPGAEKASKINPYRCETPTTAPASYGTGYDVPVLHGPAIKPRGTSGGAQPLMGA